MAVLAATFETADMFLVGSLAFAGGAVFAAGVTQGLRHRAWRLGESRIIDDEPEAEPEADPGWALPIKKLGISPIRTQSLQRFRVVESYP